MVVYIAKGAVTRRFSVPAPIPRLALPQLYVHFARVSTTNFRTNRQNFLGVFVSLFYAILVG